MTGRATNADACLPTTILDSLVKSSKMRGAAAAKTYMAMTGFFMVKLMGYSNVLRPARRVLVFHLR